MTIELKLDTNALSSLIEKDESFRLNIQQSVLENIANRYVKGVGTDVRSAVQKAAEEEFGGQFGSYITANWTKTFKLKDHLKEDIKSAVRQESRSELDAYIRSVYLEQIERAKKEIETQVRAEVYRLTREAITKEVKSRVDAAVSQLKI